MYLDGQAKGHESDKLCISGIYPHLAYWNDHGECGTGAVVPWADRLWVITYGPHFPQGSTDKLYEITSDLEITAFEGSVGGTPANRFIHRETNQLVIGNYVIDSERNVRVIPQTEMYGRLTGNARHLFEPDKKIYYATMEEGIYEVDLETLEVNELFRDYQAGAEGGQPNSVISKTPLMDTPGYHGKGLYSGQGRLIYANNGEHSHKARTRPDVPSGCLAEWDGVSSKWRVIRRNQFTDVRGPGGLLGNSSPETDPVWAIGWDHRSLLLMLLDQGEWFTYRLPKATHTYDGAHGWNTEWPRIHDINEDDLVMNMHGTFWRFPQTFSRANSAGIEPRSTYLRVVGDYTRWGDWLVFGCDDTARAEFLNKRRAKGDLASPGQSHSNLWFTKPTILDELGVPLGRGSLWMNEDVQANTTSDPYLFAGYEKRGLHLSHTSDTPVRFTLEIDRRGNDQWTALKQLTVEPNSSLWHTFDSSANGVWIRIVTNTGGTGVNAQFHYSNEDPRDTANAPRFDGLVDSSTNSYSSGLVYVHGNKRKTLGFAATEYLDGKASEPKLYVLDGELNLEPVNNAKELAWAEKSVAIPKAVLDIDEASAIYVDDKGNRWRLPKGDSSFDSPFAWGSERVDREVVTERDLFNCHGTFYELPAQNAGGFAKIRPIATHNLHVKDYCSYRGLLILSGVDANASSESEHIIRSSDGKVALWAGVVDDLWKLGKPVGEGGPWFNSDVKAGVPSDPYLMTGYDKKSVLISNNSDSVSTITLQIDIDGTGNWVDYKSFEISPQKNLEEMFPSHFSAYWIRAVCNQDVNTSVIFTYE